MLDFFLISQRSPKKGITEIYPKFIVRSSQDLMIRGGDFYAIWDEDNHLWSTDEETALYLIDRELDRYASEYKDRTDDKVKVLHMWDSDTCMVDKWHKFVQKQMRDNYHQLDEKLIFANTDIQKTDYASKKLPYSLEEGNIDAYEELMSTLYSEEERKKIEWAIGSIVANESKNLQKFLVMYGAAGTGKSTVLNIIQDLFTGYYSVFDAKALGSTSNSFALEAFKSNPLVAIQHDGDLSRIEDNTRLNSVVSHELMTVNEKFKSTYSNRFNCFLFMGTNKPVKITDAKSGILRRLIDVAPTGNKVSTRKYKELTNKIKFELGPIAWHCMSIYLEDPGAYDDYVPMSMLDSTNDFYNFVLESYETFKEQDGTTLKAAWEMYKSYCEDARVLYPFGKRAFKNELQNYFEEFSERGTNFNGEERVRNVYSGFKFDKFKHSSGKSQGEESEKPWLNFAHISSAFDVACAELSAQYATKDETPKKKWSENTTLLQDLDTHRLHYVKLPVNHIVIDFDIPDENGNKSFEKNFLEASKWPPTYAEVSKSGAGIHLHYIYNGDATELSRVYDDNIEIKVFTGKASLRRKLTKCNNLPISSISSGLPLKTTKGDKMINYEGIKTEKGLRKSIKKALNKEVHGATKPNIDFIEHILQEMYDSGESYDVTDMRQAILNFAAGSSHQADYCIKKVNKMQFKSEDDSQPEDSTDDRLVFYDVEVFPNLFLINWKYEGEGVPIVRMINPTPKEVEELLQYKLVGFNCRRYDNHILHYRLMGYNNEQLYNASQRIINNSANSLSGSAYNYSYTDVYDFAAKKQSLKKWEIELGIHHKELGLPWDKPVPEELWEEVAAYCDNDVIATEAVFNACKGDFIARQILAEVAGGTVNDTTNSLTTKIIFGNNRRPQDAFNYRNMGDVDMTNLQKYHTVDDGGSHEPFGIALNNWEDTYIVFDAMNRPVFPGYIFDHGKSTYRDIEVGEGGWVWSKPGMYKYVVTFDVASMHPSSVIAENLFGDEYTKRFKDILDARIAIKHKDFKKAKTMLNGALTRYLDDEKDAKALAQALKIAINSVYGLTAAKFDNPFRDPRNIDNIVAKRGALFMVNLKYELEDRGFEVVHVKTDSIKIVCETDDAMKEAQYHVDRLGKAYGYNFEIEHIFEKFCLVNDAVYIGKLAKNDPEEPGEWTATGTEFAVPYIFKTLFSHEPIEFKDLCETKAVSTALYLDMNEDLPDVTDKEKELSKLEDKYKKGELSDTTFESIAPLLREEIAKGHHYTFIGKVGEFCPIMPGKGGGDLMREGKTKEGTIKYSYATGSKGYKWLESEAVRLLKKEDDIDKSYFTKMVDDAVKDISEYGDFEWFVS